MSSLCYLFLLPQLQREAEDMTTGSSTGTWEGSGIGTECVAAPSAARQLVLHPTLTKRSAGEAHPPLGLCRARKNGLIYYGICQIEKPGNAESMLALGPLRAIWGGVQGSIHHMWETSLLLQCGKIPPFWLLMEETCLFLSLGGQREPHRGTRSSWPLQPHAGP